MTEISGLERTIKLRTLEISNNQIKHLSNLEHLPELEELWASSNLLHSFEEIERELKDKEKLTTVYFEANPLQFQGPTVYRNKVRLALPQVRQIDASKSRHLHEWIVEDVLTDGSFRTSIMTKRPGILVV